MQFSTKEDIEVPITDAFHLLSDFERFERFAIRRGADVERVQSYSPPRLGMCWCVEFMLRGRQRRVDVKLVDYSSPTSMRFDGEGSGIDGFISLELVELSAKRTRLSVKLNLKPKTLSARLLVQSLKLAKSNLNNRFKMRVATFAKTIEDQHKAAA